MSTKVYITGFGIISSLGNGSKENLRMLCKGSSGIALPQYLPTAYKDEMVVGEVKYSNEELKELAGLSNGKTSRTNMLGLVAVKEALVMAGLTQTQCREAGLINGTSVAGMDISEQYYSSARKGENLDYTAAFGGHDCGAGTELIADRCHLEGFISTISTACSSSANSIMLAARKIKAGTHDCIVAGGSDALSIFTLNGFNALKILDRELCRPFDVSRAGLNLGEGAAYLVLESEKSVERRKAKVFAELCGYGNANDAYHQTASSPEGRGAALAIKKALEVSGIKIGAIDYINAHGTGTSNNDMSESMALKDIFVDNVPAYSSTKSFTGHTLGAAGAIEAVFSVMAIHYNLKFQNLNLTTPMDVLPQAPLYALEENQQVNCVLSNSFGFGGNCTSLIFSGL
ncbi:beta-ketoacyl-[acyl-carrier-protein] synthase family protein [Cytophagaceae bacterium ABcell3]|nr:beta-ketoacyl-[acyl-carrier-protein] synthase family protein [Cytophagaceae bacterium ABcell3]